MPHLTPQQQLKLARRIVDGMREVGTLLLAFAPLDYSMSETRDPLILGAFVLAGGTLFAVAVLFGCRGGSVNTSFIIAFGGPLLFGLIGSIIVYVVTKDRRRLRKSSRPK